MNETYELKYYRIKGELESVKAILERITASSRANGENDRSDAYEYAEMLVKRVLEVG